jgi:hypothetical protein
MKVPDSKVGALRLIGTFAMLLLFFGASSANLAMAATNNSSGPSPQAATCESAVASTYSAMDRPTAISNAIGSREFVNDAVGYQNITFSSIFQIDKTTKPYPTCTEQVLSYNVVFTLHNSTGGWAANLVITESQNLAVLGSSLQTQAVSFANHYVDWGGYEAYTSSLATIDYAASYFYQPTAAGLSGGCGSSGTCNIGTWVGLESALGGPNGGLAQDGTGVDCVASGTSCTSSSYFAWYELLVSGGGATICSPSTGGTVTPSGGDLIFASTTNEALNSGSNTKYDFYIDDTNSLTSCYMAGNSYTSMATPTYSAFIVENAKQLANGYFDPLAGFGTAPFVGATIYTGGSYSTINNFVTSASNMENSADILGICSPTLTTNVGYGGLSSSGSFTMTYASSQYTPSYGNGGC